MSRSRRPAEWPPRRRREDRTWWSRCRPWLGPLIVCVGVTLALLAFQEQNIKACRERNQVRLVIRNILSDSYAQALHSQKVDPVTKKRLEAQLGHYLFLARDIPCPGILP